MSPTAASTDRRVTTPVPTLTCRTTGDTKFPRYAPATFSGRRHDETGEPLAASGGPLISKSFGPLVQPRDTRLRIGSQPVGLGWQAPIRTEVDPGPLWIANARSRSASYFWAYWRNVRRPRPRIRPRERRRFRQRIARSPSGSRGRATAAMIPASACGLAEFALASSINYCDASATWFPTSPGAGSRRAGEAPSSAAVRKLPSQPTESALMHRTSGLSQ